MTVRRWTLTGALAALVAAVVAPAFLAAPHAHAAAYRYWSYWLGSDSGWSFANVGPAFRIPADGSVEGWRYAVSGVTGNDQPGTGADFASVCAGTQAVEGSKRVAVIVDPGVPGDAPAGEQPPGAWAMCVVAATKATGYDVLRAAATVRSEQGLICGIGGYPARGCADVVADPEPTPTAEPTAEPTPAATPTPTAAPTSSRTPKPTATPATSTVVMQPEQEGSTVASPAPDRSSPPTSSTAPTASPTPSPTPTGASASTATPGPTYSLLTAPIGDPPAGGGPGSTIVAGIAVVGIAGLGGAAILRMRRSAP